MVLVQTAARDYEDDLDKQAEFLYFYVTNRFGKQIQIFIYDLREGRSGHLFVSNTNQTIEIKCKFCVYYIWRCIFVQ